MQTSNRIENRKWSTTWKPNNIIVNYEREFIASENYIVFALKCTCKTHVQCLSQAQKE